MDGIFQVVRAFDDAEVIHVEGDVDPIRDMEIIQNELMLKDLDWLEKAIVIKTKACKVAGTALEQKARKEELAITEKVHKFLGEEHKDVRKGTWTNREIDIINELQLLTSKPVIYLVNLSERDYVRKKNKWLPKIKAWIDENNPGDSLLPFSVALEERLVSLSDAEQGDELEKLGLARATALGASPGLAKM